MDLTASYDFNAPVQTVWDLLMDPDAVAGCLPGCRGLTPIGNDRYEASLAERRYAACDPDNRLIAATLEKSWEAALRRVQDCELRLDTAMASHAAAPTPDFAGIADDLEAAWKTPSVTMRTRSFGSASLTPGSMTAAPRTTLWPSSAVWRPAGRTRISPPR